LILLTSIGRDNDGALKERTGDWTDPVDPVVRAHAAGRIKLSWVEIGLVGHGDDPGSVAAKTISSGRVRDGASSKSSSRSDVRKADRTVGVAGLQNVATELGRNGVRVSEAATEREDLLHVIEGHSTSLAHYWWRLLACLVIWKGKKREKRREKREERREKREERREKREERREKREERREKREERRKEEREEGREEEREEGREEEREEGREEEREEGREEKKRKELLTYREP
jgi:hypothetical protein